MKFSIGLGTGAVFFFFYLSYSLAMWMSYTGAANEIEDGYVNNCINGEQIIAVTMGTTL